jgi:hypothetical protein
MTFAWPTLHGTTWFEYAVPDIDYVALNSKRSFKVLHGFSGYAVLIFRKKKALSR